MNSQAAAIWDRSACTLTVTTPKGGVVFITGARAGDYVVYGGEPISRLQLAQNESKIIKLKTKDKDKDKGHDDDD